jgi:23S rRNA pseudouridine1911/1915/1917 synthase
VPARSLGPVRRVRRRVSRGEDGRALADTLAAALELVVGRTVPRSRVRAMIAAGAVSVDGRPVRVAARPLREGQVVSALARVGALGAPAEATDRPFVLTPSAVLYRDEWLIAVAKPPGLPTHPTADPSRPSLVGHVERFLAEAGLPGRLSVHQRLDRDTSGVVLFGLAAEANEGLARAFQERAVEKRYVALTARPRSRLPASFVVDAPLSEGGKARRPVRVGGPDARDAITDVKVRETLPGALLVDARPRTGRKHQVRAHLAHAGLPILGDALYGDAAAAPRLMLHAARVVLVHPVTGRRLSIECPPPPDFGAVLTRLRAERR